MTDTPKEPRRADLLGICPNQPGPAPDITTADVRERYISDIRANEWGGGSFSMDDYAAAFDRWLAAHDAEVAAGALLEAAHRLEEMDATWKEPLYLPVTIWLRSRADLRTAGN